jgi:hypothetical protein
MGTFDYILIAVFALALIVALIRGLKHPASRFEGSFFAFILAFFLAMLANSILFLKSPGYQTFCSDFVDKLAPESLPSLGFWILSLAWCTAFFLPLFFLFRFLHRFANKRLPTLLLTLSTYLLTAYVLGLVATAYLSLNTALSAQFITSSLLVPSLYPNTSILAYFNFFVGVI